MGMEGMAQVVMPAMGSDGGAAGEVSLARHSLPAVQPVPNRLQTVLVHRLGGWGLLP